MKASSIIEYLTYFEDDNCEWFRGQADIAWELIPSISRIKNPKKSGNIEHFDWEELEEYLLEEFEKQATPFMDFKPANKWESLVHAQHHGLPTTLLDWTSNPLKALFFSVEDTSKDNIDGVVYACDIKNYSPTTKHTELAFQEERINCFQTSHLNNRIIAQEGCFSAYPLPQGFESFKSLKQHMEDGNSGLWIEHVITIPKNNKAYIRKELRKLGITHQSLFPGLDGIAKSIANSLS
jgi:hypothetical protein